MIYLIPQDAPGLIPVWASNNQSETTTLYKNPNLISGLRGNTIKGIISGVLTKSDCDLPCKRTKVSAR